MYPGWQLTGDRKLIRKALTESVNGRSGKNVYATANGIKIRITDVKVSHGLTYGKHLDSGEWRVIDTWGEQ